MKSILTLIVSLLFLGACASSGPSKARASGSRVALSREYVEIKESDKVSGDAVKVFYKKDLILPHKELGIVEAIVYGKDTGLNDLLPELQRQAALLRANAIAKIEFTRFDHGKPALHGTALAVEIKNFSEER